MNSAYFYIVFLCETATMLPFWVLSYYPFRRQLRFPWQTVVLIVGGSQIIQSFLYAWVSAHGFPARGVEFAIGVSCLVIYLICIRADRWKVLFLYIFIFDYLMITRGTAYFIEARLFEGFQPSRYPLWSTMVTLCLFAVTTPFMFLFLRRTKEQVFQSEAPDFWRTVWLLPAFTTGIVLMFTMDLSLDNVRQVQFLAARVLLILSMFIVYYILLRSLDGIREAAAAEERSRRLDELLALQRTQYEQISRHMEDTLRARHDLEQHLKVLHGLLRNGEQEAIRRYLVDYENCLPRNASRIYCDNQALNTIVSYYADQAEAADIDLFVRLWFSKELPVGEPEFCSLFGNLFSNAIEACRKVKGSRPFITINGDEESGRILLTVDNSCDQEPVIQDNRFVSTRHEGFGVGTESIRATAKRYNGWADFKYEDGIFYASVVLFGDSFSDRE